MSKVDYLIIGQGLAGSILAYQLLKNNKSFVVIDQGLESSSSLVAAGIMNPLVLKRLTFSWRAEEFIKYNETFYLSLNEFFKKNIYSEINFEKLIKSEDEYKYWNSKLSQAPLNNYISKPYSSKTKESNSIVECKLGSVSGASWLNLKLFLKEFRFKLKDLNLLIEEPFDYKKIELRNYKNFVFDKVVFCEGKEAIKNPFFDFTGFSLTKGELITIESKDLNSETILKKGVFVLPIGNNRYKVGATYDWKWENEKPTKKKKDLLISFLKEMISCEFKIIDHEAGIRPSVKDRRPILGSNPFIPHYYIFNGLGSRGCLMAPLLAKELFDFMEKGRPINIESSLNRFLIKQD